MGMYKARNGKSLYRSQGSAPTVVHFFCSKRGHSGGFSLNEQLRLLRELQDVDLELKAIEADKERYPIEIRNLDEKLASEKEMLKERREKNELLEKERRQKEGDLELEQERMKRAQSKLYEVKTNKEYQALLTEIETLKEISSQREIEILEIMDEIDDVKKEYAKMEKELLEMEKKIGAEKKNLEENLGKVDGLLASKKRKRTMVAKKLRPELMTFYQTLREKRRTAVVPARFGACQGCNMKIPPQMFNEVQKNEAIIVCPSCNRILYWEDKTDYR
jgi:predicted  nucleic acid-binding Zn-ribbon protein